VILGIDRFMSEARALTTSIGNAVASIVIACWEGELDVARLQTELAGKPAVEAEFGSAAERGGEETASR